MKWIVYFFVIVSSSIVSWSVLANNKCISHMRNHVIHADTLWLDDCKLRDEDVPAIVSYLDQHPKVTQLYILNNAIGDRGAMLLAKSKTLKMVELRNNLVSVKGAIALARSGIHMLDLQGNKLTASHLTALKRHKTEDVIILA